MKLQKCLVVFLMTGLMVGLFLTVARAEQVNDLKANKEIASLFLKETLEKGNLDEMVDKHLDANIQVEYPEAYKIPTFGTNRIRGKEAHRRAGHAWKAETRHKIRIVDVIAEGNTVVILAYMDRVFEMGARDRSFRNHPLVYIFKFKNGKIYKIIGVFDVLDEVERYKAKKYSY